MTFKMSLIVIVYGLEYMFDKLFNVRIDIIKLLVSNVTCQYLRVACYCEKVKVQCLK